MTQKKLIQAFKAFIQKSVLPYNTNNQVLINDWKHFNNIISSDPIDSNQLDFYLYVTNKSQSTNSPSFTKPPPERQTVGNINQFGKYSKRPNQFALGTGLSNGNNAINGLNGVQNSMGNSTGEKTSNSILTDKKNSMINSSGSKRKNLLNSMEIFQNLLIKNQQRLQNFNKSSIQKETSFNTSITSNGGTKKYY